MQNENLKYAPIGVLDSGVGGLSVVREIRRKLPHEDILYFADSGNCPYGTRSADQIRALTYNVALFLKEHGAKALVIACNTASTASVAWLRQLWPDWSIIGMVPAVKPAALSTKSGVVGVLATAATGKAPVLLDVIDTFATDKKVIIAAPPGLVEAVEAGAANSPEVARVLEEAVLPMLDKGADALVLGCTHFPFLRPALSRIVGDRMQLIDSGEAVARRTQYILETRDLLNPSGTLGKIQAFSTGEPAQARRVISQLLEISNPAELDLQTLPVDFATPQAAASNL
jgi:glutamate racemase